MINNKRVIALIPARGGSKSIPKKNIKLLGGKPLIAWTIEVAQNTVEIDRVIVSTDCEDISDVSKKYGAEVQVRPRELAKDDSLVIDTIRYTLNRLKEEGEQAEYLVLLEPTAPFRKAEDISNCINLLVEGEYDSVATFTEAELNPHRAWKIENDEVRTFINGTIPWLPRQKLPRAYQLNGAVYVIRINKVDEDSVGLVLEKSGAVIMPKERSIDIDHYIDLLIAEQIINGGNNK